MSASGPTKNAAAALDETRGILPRHVSGDPAAFREFMNCFRAPVYSYLVRIGVHAANRDDLFQEIFIRVHKAAPAYKPELPVEPWLFTIAANTVRSHYRKENVRNIVQARDDVPEQHESITAADLAEANETMQWLEQAVQKLPEAQRDAIALCCVKNIGQQEAAQILNIPLNTLKTNLSRGRATLARNMAKRAAISRREVLQ